MLTHSVLLIGGTEDETATLIEDELEDTCSLQCLYRGKCLMVSADDFFEALCQIRLQLEIEGLGLACYGASLNVYPSGMARSMGGGRLAYKTRAGAHAKKEDLVCIFSSGLDVMPATVAMQLQHFNAWVTSARQ